MVRMNVNDEAAPPCSSEAVTLLQYMHQKKPALVQTIHSILWEMIWQQGNFDPNNTSIILCDEKLEKALNVKSCHVDQLKDIIHTRLALPKEMRQHHSFVSEAPRTAHRRYVTRVSPYRAVVRNHNIHAGTKVILRPKFAELLNTVEGAHRNQMVFRWDETCDLVTKYIVKNEDRILDKRNPAILNLRDDKMGDVFGVLALHRNQIMGFTREQIIPYDIATETGAAV